MKHIFKQGEIDCILKEYSVKKCTKKEICNKHNISYNTLTSILNSNTKTQSALSKKAVMMQAEGYDNYMISDRLNVSFDNVKYLLKKDFLKANKGYSFLFIEFLIFIITIICLLKQTYMLEGYSRYKIGYTLMAIGSFTCILNILLISSSNKLINHIKILLIILLSTILIISIFFSVFFLYTVKKYAKFYIIKI